MVPSNLMGTRGSWVQKSTPNCALSDLQTEYNEKMGHQSATKPLKNFEIKQVTIALEKKISFEVFFVVYWFFINTL